MNISKFLETPILKNIGERLLLIRAIWTIFARKNLKKSILRRRINYPE